MSAGNLGAAIGLANTNKIPPIGGLVADTVFPTAGAPYIGENLGTDYAPTQYWVYNFLGENPADGIFVPSCNVGKTLNYVTTGGATLTVPVDGLLAGTAEPGVVVAAPGAGALKTFIPAGTTIPAGSFFWIETV